MILSWLILILSLAVVSFYFQATCQRILRRQFERKYFQAIAKVTRLEFPSLQKALEGIGAPVDHSRLPKALKDDFLTLTYLLKNVATAHQRYAKDERLLILYCHLQFFSLAVRHLLRVGEKEAILRLISALRCFASVVGQQLDIVQRLANAAEVPWDARGA